MSKKRTTFARNFAHNAETTMRVYTIQTIVFYEELLHNGVAYCNRESEWCRDCKVQYDWMAEQMRKRIGGPPIPEIKYPVWVWLQYNSKKAPMPPMSPKEIPSRHEEAVMLELDVPEDAVLLSDLDLWLLPLNHWAINNKREDKLLYKKLGLYEEKHGKCYEMHEYPEEIRRKIFDSWDRVFDLDIRDRYITTARRQNRSIQGTIWLLRKEWLKVAHIFNRHSEMKRIVFA